MTEEKIPHVKIVKEKLADAQMRENLSTAMHILQKNRRALIESKYLDWQGLREHAKCVKNNALMSLKERLAEFEENAVKNGFKVHYAQTPEEACRIIYELALERGVSSILKGKSMASEEIGLNAYLKSRGIRAEESDLGELILQLNEEKPVHIVVPAIHRNRREVNSIFKKKLKAPDSKTPEELNRVARSHLRSEFEGLKMGLSGVNFAISKEGALWLIENEGNGRMCTTAPQIHVALCGIEKVVETFDDAAALVHLLTPSATGQFIPAYNNIIAGPRRCDELDGPQEVHVVLFDHHRSDMLADPDFYEALRCIRCGACMNFCPVYEKIGGHAYQTTYPGPIGEVISPNLYGIDENADILSFCSQCQRCSEVCPERIPLAKLIRVLRAYKAKEAPHKEVNLTGFSSTRASLGLGFAMRLFAKAATHSHLWQLAIGKAHHSSFLLQLFGPILPVTGRWAKYKSLPRLDEDFYKALEKLDGVTIED